jgi:hypothetical protein
MVVLTYLGPRWYISAVRNEGRGHHPGRHHFVAAAVSPEGWGLGGHAALRRRMTRGAVHALRALGFDANWLGLPDVNEGDRLPTGIR